MFPSFLRVTPQVETKVRLHHIHTGEYFSHVFVNGEEMPHEARKELNAFMRDWRTGGVQPINQNLIKLLPDIQKALDFRGDFHIVCGYRSPQTNAHLRNTRAGVAKNSLHCKGDALDLFCPKVSLRSLRDCVQRFQAGGVGYYPKSGFIHMDIRDQPTYWPKKAWT